MAMAMATATAAIASLDKPQLPYIYIYISPDAHWIGKYLWPEHKKCQMPSINLFIDTFGHRLLDSMMLHFTLWMGVCVCLRAAFSTLFMCIVSSSACKKNKYKRFRHKFSYLEKEPEISGRYGLKISNCISIFDTANTHTHTQPSN